MEYVVWDKGRPIAATPKEAKRLKKRLAIVDKVLKELGYTNGIGVQGEDYSQIMTKMAQKDFAKYMQFIKRVDDLAKKEGC